MTPAVIGLAPSLPAQKKAVPTHPSPAPAAEKPPRTLVDFIPPEESARLRELRANADAMQKEFARLMDARSRADHALTSLVPRRGPDVDGAARRWLGEESPLPPAEIDVPEVADRPLRADELSDTIKGLNSRIEHAKRHVQTAEGAYSSGVVDALAKAADAAAKMYLEGARMVEEGWFCIETMQMLAGELAGNPYKATQYAPGQNWADIRIPGVDVGTLPTLFAASKDGGSLGPLVFSGRIAREGGLPDRALRQMKQAIVTALGHWPFK